ncbi:phosphoribosylamine--glycine ligase [Helicobacter sp.]|uniref:phosphoribosylamine--glycine ligase n=1 Tax=Helicobacter sp. TaxID=218 RepID=UPI0025C0C5F0|nr:phosphoribosylamine--glycine ligase [Helicobacter sp.]MCI5967908.1 phosphoribosylamine--glycine ligase [Helicobacter sp.]MDY2584797.1 phosphoribosylamine--glycine ligase [Helicobacter sp.]
MEVVIVGSGGREYSIGLALQSECRIDGIYFYPGNGATSKLGKNVDFKTQKEFVDFALKERIGLVIIGPEAPLVEGLADVLRENGIATFGPSAKAARLEGSKAYMKEFAKRYRIPTASFIQTQDYKEACAFIDALKTPIVVKADGLCAGKGVMIAQSYEEAKRVAKEMLEGKSFGDSGKTIVIEEFLEGFELSIFAMCDGRDFIVLPAAQDHKRLLENNKGPNTGGMGAYAPSPLASKEILAQVEQSIIAPTLEGMGKEGSAFSGVLFCGIMVVKDKPYLLEFNVRFGDPECEVLMPLFKEGLLDCFLACAKGGLKSVRYSLSDEVCVGVVVASKDYPYKNSKKEKIKINFQDSKDAHISFAGVSKEGESLLATGGRVLVCVGKGESVQEAVKRAYDCVESVEFEGMQYRKDIAYQAWKC